MITAIAAAAYSAFDEHTSFHKELDAMPEEFRASAAKRRHDAFILETEERRHREMVEAAKPNNNATIMGFMLGFIFGKSL